MAELAQLIQNLQLALNVLEKNCESPSAPGEVTDFLLNERPRRTIEKLNHIQNNLDKAQNTDKNTSIFRFAIIGERDAIKIDFTNALLAEENGVQAFASSPTLNLLCGVQITGTGESSPQAQLEGGKKIPLENLTALIKKVGNKQMKLDYGVSKESEILLSWPQENSTVLRDGVEIHVLPATREDMHEAHVVIIVGDLAQGIGKKKKELACEKARDNILVVYDANLSFEDSKTVEKRRQDVKEFAQSVFFVDLKQYNQTKKIEDCGELKELLEYLKASSSTESKLSGAQADLNKLTDELRILAKKILSNLYTIKTFLVSKKEEIDAVRLECQKDEGNIPIICNDILKLFDSVILEGEIEPIEEYCCQCCYESCRCERMKWKFSVEEKMKELEKNRMQDRGVFNWFLQTVSPCTEISIEKEENLTTMAWYCDHINTQFRQKFLEYITTPSTTGNSLRKHLSEEVDINLVKIEPSSFRNLANLDYNTLHDIHFYARNAKFMAVPSILVFFPAYVVVNNFFACLALLAVGLAIGIGTSCLVRYRNSVSCKRVQRMNAFLRKVGKECLEKKLMHVLERFNKGRSVGNDQCREKVNEDLPQLEKLISEIECFLRS